MGTSLYDDLLTPAPGKQSGGLYDDLIAGPPVRTRDRVLAKVPERVGPSWAPFSPRRTLDDAMVMGADVVATLPRVASALGGLGAKVVGAVAGDDNPLARRFGTAQSNLMGLADSIEEWGAPRDGWQALPKLAAGVGKYVAMGPAAGIGVGSAEAYADPRTSQTALVAELDRVQNPVAQAVGGVARNLSQTGMGRVVGDLAFNEATSAAMKGLGRLFGKAPAVPAAIPDVPVQAETRMLNPGWYEMPGETPLRWPENAAPQPIPHPRVLGPGQYDLPAQSPSTVAEAKRTALEDLMASLDAKPRLLPASTGGPRPMPAKSPSTVAAEQAAREAALESDPFRQAMLSRAARTSPRSGEDAARAVVQREAQATDLTLAASARTPSGARRNVAKVSSDGLLAELDDVGRKVVDAQSRAVYNFTEADVSGTQYGLVIPTATRKGKGPSMQAKALRNLEDLTRIQDEVTAELKRRGYTDDEIFEQLMKREESRLAPQKAAAEASRTARAKLDAAERDRLRADYDAMEERAALENEGLYDDIVDPDLRFSGGSGPAVVRAMGDHPVASTATGAAVGAANDEENRLRGAVVGGAVGLAGSRAAAGKGGVGLSIERREPQLSVFHNLNADKLRAADQLGGLPAPSLAVVPTDNAFQGFGDITFIGRKALGTPGTSRVFDADVYSPRAPRPTYAKARTKEIEPLVRTLKDADPTDVGTVYDVEDALLRGDVDKAEDALYTSAGARAAFLKSKGVEVPSTSRDRREAVGQYPWEEYDRYVRDLVAPYRRDPVITVGKRKVPHTLQSATDVMTRGEVRGREQNGTFGVGAARAKRAREFDDLERMRAAARERIRPREEVDAAHVGAMDDPWTQAMLEYNGNRPGEVRLGTWEALDALHRALGKAKGPQSLRAALSREGFGRVPDELIESGIRRAQQIQEAPTAYFEARPSRAVPFGDFAGAVIPKDAPAEVREILTRRGIPFREYEGGVTGSREAARKAFLDDLESQGAEVRFSGGPAEVGAAAVGYQTAPEDATEEEKATRALMLAGGVAGARYLYKRRAPVGHRVPTPTPDIPVPKAKGYTGPVEVDDFANIAKFGLDASGEQRLRATVDKVVRERGIAPKGVQSWEEVGANAKALGLDADALLKKGDAKRLNGSEMLAIREIVADNVRALDLAAKEMAGSPSAERAAALDLAMSNLERQNDALLSRFVRARTQAGRDLNNLKIIAQQTLDPAYWLAKAARQLGVESLPADVHTALSQKLAAGDKAGVATMVAGLKTHTLSQKITQLWKVGLLTNPRTHIANAVSNTVMGAAEIAKDVPAYLADRLLMVATGQASKAAPTRQIVAASWKGARAGVEDAKRILRGEMVPDALGKFDLTKGEVDFGNRFLNAYGNWVFRALSASDKVFSGSALKRSLAEQATVMAQREGLKGSALTARVAQLMDRPLEPMAIQAIADAQVATFQNPNAISESIAKLKGGLKKIPRIGEFVGESVLPFSRTPGAVASSFVRYSPVGAADGLAQAVEVWHQARKGTANLAAQRKAVEDIGRGAVGTAVLWMGYTLAKDGLMSGAFPSATDERARWQASNRQENSVLINGKWRSVEKLGPVGVLMATGANLAELVENPETSKLGDLAAATASSMLKTIGEQSSMTGLESLTEAIGDPKRAAARYVRQQTGSVVPAIVAGVARATDPTMREAETVGDAVRARIPGASTRLPAKLDVFGEERKGEGGAVANLVDPTYAKTDRRAKNALVAELDRIELGISPLKRKAEETPAAFRARVQAVGRAMTTELRAAMESPSYTDDLKLEAEELRRDPESEYYGQPLDAVTKALQRDYLRDVITNVRRLMARGASDK